MDPPDGSVIIRRLQVSEDNSAHTKVLQTSTLRGPRCLLESMTPIQTVSSFQSVPAAPTVDVSNAVLALSETSARCAGKLLRNFFLRRVHLVFVCEDASAVDPHEQSLTKFDTLLCRARCCDFSLPVRQAHFVAQEQKCPQSLSVTHGGESFSASAGTTSVPAGVPDPAVSDD